MENPVTAPQVEEAEVLLTSATAPVNTENRIENNIEISTEQVSKTEPSTQAITPQAVAGAGIPSPTVTAHGDHALTRVIRLEMKGFKSFANKTEVIFGEKFNCIIGPNGSGKSNILDALCFVLGKSSAKSMRVERSANLIYNGGKTKNPAKEAEVSIFFDNSQFIFPIQTPQVKITRIVKLNGTSVYKINDETSTRNQILDVLMVARIDPDGYNIILQGDITGLIKMSSEERRMLIDEVSGIGEYEDKRHKAELELNKVDTQLKESDIILAERGTYMKELKKERDQALKFKDLEEKLKRNKATILNRKVEERQVREQKLAKQLADDDEKIGAIQAKIDGYKSEVSQRKERVKELNKDLQSKSSKEQQTLNAEIEKLKITQTKTDMRIQQLTTELQRLTERRTQLDKQQSDTQSRVSGIDQQLKSGEYREKAIAQELGQVQERILAVRKKHNLEDAGAVDDKIATLDKEVEQAQDEITRLRQEEQALVREHDKLEFQLQAIDGTIGRLQELETEYKEQVHALKAAKLNLTALQKDLQEALGQAKSLQKEHELAEAKLRKAEEELAKLRSRNIQIREAAQGNIAVQKILELRGKKKGIHGTVAELGSVREEHSLALEIAAGGRMRSIVVDDDGVAQECIEYLRANRLGVATFLPLNKVRGTSGERPNGSGVVGLAIDLITFKPEFAPAFKYVFGATVVVDDIGAARSIGIGRYRMVTITGDLVEIAGAMSGGHLQRGKQGMGFQEQELVDKLARSEHDVLDLETLERTLADKRERNSEGISSFRNKAGELEAEVTKLERLLKIDAGDTGASAEEKTRLKTASSAAQQKLDTVQQRIGELNRKLASGKGEKQKLRESLSQLRNPAVLAELSAFDQERQKLETERITIKAQTDSLRNQKTSIYEPEIENTARVFKQLAADEVRFAKEQETLTVKKVQDEEVLKVKEEEFKTFYQMFQKLFKERDNLGDEINKIEGRTIEEEDKIRKAEQGRGSVQIVVAQVRAELAGLAEEGKQYVGVEPFKTKDLEDCEREIKQFDRMLADMGAINMKALEIYETAEREYNDLNAKKLILNTEREQVLLMINEVDTKKKDLFVKMFALINEQFKRIFLQLNTKGEAFLELENPDDPLNAGMNIKVRLQGNKFLDINSLSGGEKTMTALAFLFAIQEHEPAQFYVLDEIDAALDKRNAEKLGKLVRQYCSKAQYIVISHNDAVITEADQIYGVSMNEHGESKVTSLKV